MRQWAIGIGVLGTLALGAPGAGGLETGAPACSAWSVRLQRCSSFGQAATAGRPAPDFHLTSGDSREISLDQVKGKIIVLIYETKDGVEQNRPFKNELTKLFAQSEALKAATVVLSVVNCSSAVWPATKIWQAKLRENSKKENLTLYGDWDGAMASEYGMKDKESNIVIIDPTGLIRFFHAGKLEDDDIPVVLTLLKELGKKGLFRPSAGGLQKLDKS